MTGNALAQLVLYFVALTALAYPLGIYMARVYEGRAGLAELARDVGGFVARNRAGHAEGDVPVREREDGRVGFHRVTRRSFRR